MEQALRDIQQSVNDVKDGQADILIRLESVEKDIDTVKKTNSVIQNKLSGATLGASLSSNNGVHLSGIGLSNSTQQSSASAASGTAGHTPPGNTVSKGDPFASVQDE